jgi:hypothetical protein
VSKAQIVLEIVILLQGTPVGDFARDNFTVAGSQVVVRCAQEAKLATPGGQLCKRAVATALQRYSYRFSALQLPVLADLFATALENLEPSAVPRVRSTMCDPASDDAQWDRAAAAAVCERLSRGS